MTNRVNWTIDTRAVQPRTIQILRGETVALDVDLTSYGSPVDLGGATCSAFWRSPDMASGAAWYTGAATCSGNRVSWVWDGATMDAGAEVYDWFIGVDGDGLSYRPCGKISMIGSPAGNPSVPIPTPILDFAKYTVVNSPFPTFGEVETTVDSAVSGKVDTSALAETLGDYYTAAQTETAIEAATSGLATSADLSLYLPLSGGAVLGPLTADTITAAHPVEVNGRLYGVNSISRGSEHLDFPSGTGVFALTSDIQTATSGKAERSDLSRYLPLSGGEVTGQLDAVFLRVADGTAENGLYVGTAENYTRFFAAGVMHTSRYGASWAIGYPQRNGVFALVSDVDAATSGKADASALSGYLPKSENITVLSIAPDGDIGLIVADAAGVYQSTYGTNGITHNYPDFQPHALAFPAGGGTLAVTTDISAAIGDINTVLDTINGEVI